MIALAVCITYYEISFRLILFCDFGGFAFAPSGLLSSDLVTEITVSVFHIHESERQSSVM